MGYNCSATGAVTIDVSEEAAAVQAFLAHPTWGPAAQGALTVGDVLAEALHYDVVDLSDQPNAVTNGKKVYQLSYGEKWHDDILDGLEVLAAAGLTGGVDYSGEDGARWKLALAGGTCRELSGLTIYPGDPDVDQPCVALTRRDAQALLALLAGDHVDGLDAVVKKLTLTVS